MPKRPAHPFDEETVFPDELLSLGLSTRALYALHRLGAHAAEAARRLGKDSVCSLHYVGKHVADEIFSKLAVPLAAAS